jgi:predicted O-methyltransferase YrrM
MLELGTGTGISAAWILSGMDGQATLVSIDNDSRAQHIAVEHLGGDTRLEIVCADAAEWLAENRQARYDLVFADAWPGKFSHLELALGLLIEGGIYVIDDLLPQQSWPEGHAPRVPALMREIESMPGFVTLRMAWASGLMLVVRQGPK